MDKVSYFIWYYYAIDSVSLLPLISGIEFSRVVIGMFLPFCIAEPKSPNFTRIKFRQNNFLHKLQNYFKKKETKMFVT